MILENMEEKKRTAGLTAELKNLKKELAMYQTTEEERWEKKKKEFLKSLKFYDLLGHTLDFSLTMATRCCKVI